MKHSSHGLCEIPCSEMILPHREQYESINFVRCFWDIAINFITLQLLFFF